MFCVIWEQEPFLLVPQRPRPNSLFRVDREQRVFFQQHPFWFVTLFFNKAITGGCYFCKKFAAVSTRDSRHFYAVPVGNEQIRHKLIQNVSEVSCVSCHFSIIHNLYTNPCLLQKVSILILECQTCLSPMHSGSFW